MMTYTISLPDYEKVLPELCRVIKAKYSKGDFDKFHDTFEGSKKDIDYYFVEGKSGVYLRIKLEKYEGYFFSDLVGKGKEFEKAKQILWERYINIGGNPDVQECP